MSAVADTHQTLIGGESRAACSGSHFDVPSGSGPSAWPRSDRADLESALVSLRAGTGILGGLDEGARLGVLSGAWSALVADPDRGGTLASRLGLSSEECLEILLEGEVTPVLNPELLVSRFSEDAAPAEGSVVLIRLHWGEMLRDLFVCVAAELFAGRCVLLVSDPRVPGLAQGLADLLLDAGLAPDTLALLHDDGESVLRAAVASLGVSGFILSGFERKEFAPERGGGTSFGDGIVEMRSPAWCHRLLVPRALRVEADEDPKIAARRVAGDLFSRVPSLSGQLPGMPSIVEVAPRLLSAFTTELLLTLENPKEGLTSAANPCPWVDGALAAYLERTLADGIDGGATLIHEERRPSFTGDPTSGTIQRLVFTNVEGEMRVLEQVQPAPVVLIRRGGPYPSSSSSTA